MVEHERFKGPGGRYGDLDEEVVASGDDEHREHIVEPGDRVAELFDGFPGLRLEADGDDGLHAATHRFQVDLGVVAGDHPLLLKAADTVVAGRVGDPQLASDLTVAAPGVCPESSEDLKVEAVKFHSNSLWLRNIDGKIVNSPKNAY